jgi:hypothetical protein
MIDERNRLRLKQALIEPFGPPKPNLERIALASLERTRARRTLGRVLALTAFVVFMALAASIALAGRLLQDNSGPVHLSPQQIALQLAELRQRPLSLPALGPNGSCPETPQLIKNIYFKLGPWPNQTITTVVFANRGPIYGIYGFRAPETTGKYGYYYRVTYLSDPVYNGLALVRGRRLDGTQQLMFSGPLAAGSPMTADAVGDLGASTQFFDELVLPPGPPNRSVWRQWRVLQGVPGAGCYGFQVDGPSFHDSFVVSIPPGG